MEHDIFISYSHEDKSSADGACAILESEGLRCWMAPRDILPGAEWTESIMDGIGGAKALVLIFSRYSDGSPQVRREVERALHHAIPIVPVRIEDVMPGKAMEYLISTPHWLDAISPPVESHYRHLAGSLKLLIARNSDPTKSKVVPAPRVSVEARISRPASKAKSIAMFAGFVTLIAIGLVVARGLVSHDSPAPASVATPPNPAVPQAEATQVEGPNVPTQGAANSGSFTQGPAPPITAPYRGRIFKNSIGMKFVQIMPGTYLMGSPADEVGRSDDETQHRVTLTRGFYIGQTDVTVGQFGAFVNDSGYQTQAEAIGSALQWNGRNWAIVLRGCWHNPGFGQDSDHPVVDISWNDAMAFCDWMGSKEGRHYRLPTEAQYEYCVRAGTTTTYQWGNDVDDGKGWGNFKDLPWLIQFPTEPAFPWDDGYKFTSPVGKFPPNPWNLYDMPGNVLDWCSDWYGEYPDGDVTDPQGPSTDDAPSVTNPWFRTYHGPCRDLRGASWHAQPANVRSAWRGFAPALSVESNTGFRVVLDSP